MMLLILSMNQNVFIKNCPMPSCAKFTKYLQVTDFSTFRAKCAVIEAPASITEFTVVTVSYCSCYSSYLNLLYMNRLCSWALLTLKMQNIQTCEIRVVIKRSNPTVNHFLFCILFNNDGLWLLIRGRVGVSLLVRCKFESRFNKHRLDYALE